MMKTWSVPIISSVHRLRLMMKTWSVLIISSVHRLRLMTKTWPVPIVFECLSVAVNPAHVGIQKLPAQIAGFPQRCPCAPLSRGLGREERE